VGVYTINNTVFDIYLMILFGVFGYVSRKFDYEPAPFILAVVLGPMMEKALRQSLIMSKGEFSIFLNRPISGVILSVAIFLLFFPLVFQGVKHYRKRTV
jgi:putative tricarboxylic transport membrane protein